MTDRPIARYHEGRLEMDCGGRWDERSDAFLRFERATLIQIDKTGHATRIQQITEALEAYEEGKTK